MQQRTRILWSIRTKLISLILFFVFIPFAVTGLLWYERSTEEIESNAIQSSDRLIKQINGQLDYYFTTLQRSTYPLLIHPLVQDFLTLDPADSYSRYELTGRIQNELLSNIAFSRPDIYSIAIVSSKNIAVSQSGGYSMIEYYENYVDKLNDENYKIVGVSKVNTLPVLTILRRFVDAKSYRSAGMLVLQLRMNEINQICANVNLGSSGFVWLMDENGRIVYHPDHDKIGQQADRSLTSKFSEATNGWFSTADHKLIIYHQSDTTRWTMVSEVPLRELTENITWVRNFNVWIGIVLLSSTTLLLVGFSFQLTRSIKRLQRLMRLAEEGDLNARAPDRNRDEIGDLNRSFNLMVSKIKNLMEEVHTSRLKENELEIRRQNSELEALYSRINPHFLYNTLEMMNSHAILIGSAIISKMSTSLADLFRYSISNPKERVTLEDEIRNTRQYLDIQKQRFPHLIVEYGFDEKGLQRVLAIRLMVQPLIENSFLHGYQTRKLKLGYIGLFGRVEDEAYVLTIVDRGKGMDPAIMEKYNEAFSGTEDNLPISKKDRIGLWNVHQRIRLTYGPPFGLAIRDSGTSGTEIEILLPLLSTGGESDA
ncbi:sensor histidine kinase [Cohnella fermenti]|nr:histidine kinase [Cohnella fermenti]